MCNLSFFDVNGRILKQLKKLIVEPNRANKNTLRANFLFRVDYFFSQKIRKTEKFLRFKTYEGLIPNSSIPHRGIVVFLTRSHFTF